MQIQSLSDLKPGSHCLLIPDGFEAKISTLTSYIKTGIEKNEKCVALLDGLSLDALRTGLRCEGLNVDDEVECGRLVLSNNTESYLSGEKIFDPDRMLGVWEGILRQSGLEGFSGIRVTGDLAWATVNSENIERLFNYERLVEGIFEAAPRITAICVYDRGLFSKAALLEALKTHPLIVQNDSVRRNTFFDVPSHVSRELSDLPDIDDYLCGRADFQVLEKKKSQIEQTYSRLLSVIPGIVYRLNQDLSIDILNDFHEELTGYTRKELSGGNGAEGIYRLVHPEDRKSVIVRKCAPSGKAVQVFRMIRKDGSQAWVQDISRDVFVKGRYSHSVGLILDITDRVRADEKMRESEQNFRALAENAGIGIIILVDGCGHVYANSEAADITGYSVEELHATSYLNLIIPEELDMLSERFRKRLAGEDVPSRYETCIISKNGNRVPLEISPTRTTWCGQEAVMVIFRDITERRRAEETIRKSEAHLKVAQHIAGMGSWEWDTLTDTVTWTDELHFMTGISSKAFDGTMDSALETVHPHDREAVRAALSDSMSEGKPFSVEHRIVRRNGSELTVCSEGWVTREVDGRPVVVSGVCRNITESKKREAELRKAEAKFRSLIDQLPSKICIYMAGLDEAAHAVYISPQIMSFGYSPEQWLGEPGLWRKLLHAEDRGRVMREFRNSRKNRVPFNLEYRISTRDGRLRWVRDEAVVIKDESGAPLFFQGVLIDITEEKRAEAALLENSQELLQLNSELHKLTVEITRIEETERKKFAEMLHENIGQNLAAIKMLVETSANQLPASNRKIKGALSNILYLLDESIRAARGLTADLYPAPFKDMGLGDAVKWYVGSFIVPKGIKAELDIDDKAMDLGEEVRQVLFKVIRESLQNAMKHSSADRMEVSFNQKNGAYLLSIKDNGSGFDSKALKKDRGFGLVLMREWVKSIGGRFSVNSSIGMGTEVLAEISGKKGMRIEKDDHIPRR